MKFSLLDDLPNILDRFTKFYMIRRDHEDVSDINNGECFVWAWHVYQFLKRRRIECQLITCDSHGGHAWVEIDGLGYDSEHLWGYESEMLAEDFACASRENIDFGPMDEDDFFDHWYRCGRCGYLMFDTEFMNRNARSISQCGRKNKKIA